VIRHGEQCQYHFARWGLFLFHGSPSPASEMATFRIEQTAESSALLKDDAQILVIEHSDVGAARVKVKMLLLNEAQERTGPGDVLELAEGSFSPVRRRCA